MRLAICYVSNSSSDLSPKEIHELLSDCQSQNNKRNIKGLLLYSEGNFFQVIEGDTQEVKTLWTEIKQDERHKSIIKIFEEEIETPPFDGYLCDFISEDEKHPQHNLKRIFDQLKSLDEKPKNAAEEVLKLFLKCH
ncbi:BLUF domain-containing protein [Mesonia sp.]|uniref:BLUF domain-containing protein n=1 Tax=Mesonia sp. TaxID=1960830 RepID=UPI00175FF28D|nr:BLUF domain-containing protein [Mesonia sp.]HIB38566.1 BLUF domain-containing protein [Mesonia sp.]HIO26893.1 BLUF domain-containing protein [Flavobacteriaceae bacterium]